MSKKIIESQIRGLKCDNPNCDWVDMSISVEDYHKYVGAKCPKCGEIVLTEADFKAIKTLLKVEKFLNCFSFLVKDNGKRTKVKLSTDGNGVVDITDIEEVKE